MGEIIKGKPVADVITEKVKKEVEEIRGKGIVPNLTIVRVGNNPSDLSYERGALKRMDNCGIDCKVIELSENVEQAELIKVLNEINIDENVNGILIFRPLPGHIDEDVIKYHISAEKDVDCMSPVNVAKLMEGDETGFPPCTPTAVMEMLSYYNPELKGTDAVVIGRSMVVGKPVSMLLLKENATVTICHLKTKDLPGKSAKSEVLVVGVGRAKMVDDTYVNENTIVIDVGINVDEEGNLCGDADFDKCIEKAKMVTPVPGGVGSVTTSVLAKHVLKACRQQNNL